MKVALVQDWLLSRGGAERVLYDLHCMYPEAPIYVLVYDPARAPEWTRECDIRTSYIQGWPGGVKHYQKLLSFMPRAWEALDFSEYDLVISSCSSCCKGIITRPDALHICYCHSPIRYVWDLYYEYLGHAGSIKRFAMKRLIHKVRQWDFLAAQRVDYFVANSDYVAKRISKYYRRDSVTIHPSSPISVEQVMEPGDYYLVISRFVHYKRVDIAIQACNELGRHLIIVGSDGEELQSLKAMAGPTVEFLGHVSDSELRDICGHARALLFPGVEDFGLTPVESMAAGVPVLAYGKGGVTETVLDGRTGFFFHEQTAESLERCMLRFEEEGVALSRQEIREYARGFSPQVFKATLQGFIDERLAGHGIASGMEEHDVH